jgi:hypothetical protein
MLNDSASLTTPTATKRRESRFVAAPKDYFLGPVFAATKQSGPREVTVGERLYQIGGFHPIKRNVSPPALDVRHARAIFSLLSFRDPFDDDGTLLIRFSFNEFCLRYANSNGGRYARAIGEIVGDLIDSYIRVTDLKTKIAHEYRLIERIDIEKRPPRRSDSKIATSNQREMWFNGCTLSPEFAGLLNRIAELQHLNLDVFTSIRSPLAQAIYLYIPSRAFHHSEDEPFEITATKLLDQVSFHVPPHKSVRRRAFSKHEEEGRSVIQQLNGVETLTGRFRVALAETADGSDWKLQAWIEQNSKKAKVPPENSKLVTAYLQSGRARELLDQALANIKPLSSYEEDLLEAGRVEVNGNRKFFEMAKAILKEARFDGLLAEAKNDEIEGRSATKTPTARLIHRIMEAISAPIKTGKSATGAIRN